MKKLIMVILVTLAILAGCGTNRAEEVTEPAGQMQLGNPWKSYDTLADAETACGLTFPIPENVPAGYEVVSFRVMNSSLLEVTYQNGEAEITVRMQAGDDADISGVYENFADTETFDQNGAVITRKLAESCHVYLIQKSGYTFSICATGIATDDACQEILSHLC